MFKFCLISNFSNSVLLLIIFMLLHKQGKLIITRQKNKKENFRYIIDENGKVYYTVIQVLIKTREYPRVL